MAADRDASNEAEPGQPPSAPISEASTKIGKDEGSLWKTIKLYRAAVWWSIAFATTITMEHYTDAIGTMFFANDAFSDYFAGTGGQVTGIWMTAIGFANIFGRLVGSLFNGWFSEKYGQRKATFLALIWLDIGLIPGFCATRLWMLLLSNMLVGLPFGMFSNLGITYAADVCPPRIRAYLVSFSAVCQITGQLAATALVFGFLPLPSLWAFRIPWALTWVPGLGLLVVYWAPESPVWLVRRGRPDLAWLALKRLMTNNTDEEIDARLMVIRELNEEEKALATRVSFKHCFQRGSRRLTFITCLVAYCGWACGYAMVGHAVFFLKVSGTIDIWDYLIPFLQCVIGVIATVCGAVLLDFAGRLTIWLGGLLGCVLVLTALGFAGIALGIWQGVPTNEPAGWVVVALVLVYSIVRNVSIGPVSQILFTEIPTVRLRQKTTAIARALSFATMLGNTFLIPYFVSPDQLNLAARASFIFAVLCLIGLVGSCRFVPETKINIKKEQRRLENTASLIHT